MQDTYYVVAHLHYLSALMLVGGIVIAIWWGIFRMSAIPPRRLGFATVGSFLIGSLLLLLPVLSISSDFLGSALSLSDAEAAMRRFRTVNIATSVGAILTSSALFVSLVVLIRTAANRLRQGG